jgi:hypothetical protein
VEGTARRNLSNQPRSCGQVLIPASIICLRDKRKRVRSNTYFFLFLHDEKVGVFLHNQKRSNFSDSLRKMKAFAIKLGDELIFPIDG